ncbi:MULTISPECIES: hypothetical protein [unclassified Desulfurobacterium]|uniref:hypothetical protein n=1 Tax=Desulfurobacterium sp. TC5-1 TaxID=1158318 RepID=UPI0003B373B5|nr:hypothetical protein [Desulfurobacterium sp. TC5-1]
MENLKGKLVFIQTTSGEGVIPSSGIIGILDEIGDDYLKIKDAGMFALIPTSQGAQATIMPVDPTANEPVDAIVMKSQIVTIVPVGERSRLKEFHQQFKAAAAGIELPSTGLDISKIKEFPKGGQGGISLT